MNTGPTIQDVVNTGMRPDHIREVVNGIAIGIRHRLGYINSERGARIEDIHTSLARIADALDYLVALTKIKEQ